MRPERWKQIVRQFPENGMKLLLQEPANVRDLLALTQSDLLPLIDFERLRLVRTTFVARDFRHVEADVVLRAPLRVEGSSQQRGVVWLYILIEHQSEPDLLMPIRLLDYVVQIIKMQIRSWTSTHASFAGFRVQPVLPVVLYTGIKRWRSPGRLLDLVELGERFGRLMPDLEPLFVNLQTLAPGELVARGGALAWVLRLVRDRKARPREFRRLLEEAVVGLESLPGEQRLRWLELLSYIHMLVYHDREGREQRVLQEVIEASVQTDVHRREVETMQRTIAEEMKEVGRQEGRQQGREEGRQQGREEGRQEGRQEGEVQARQQTLLRQLRHRFGDIPPATASAINACGDVEQLGSWLDAFATANTLQQVGITATRSTGRKRS